MPSWHRQVDHLDIPHCSHFTATAYGVQETTHFGCRVLKSFPPIIQTWQPREIHVRRHLFNWQNNVGYLTRAEGQYTLARQRKRWRTRKQWGPYLANKNYEDKRIYIYGSIYGGLSIIWNQTLWSCYNFYLEKVKTFLCTGTEKFPKVFQVKWVYTNFVAVEYRI